MAEQWYEVHFNPESTKYKTKCGRSLAKVHKASKEASETTCKTCLRMIRQGR